MQRPGIAVLDFGSQYTQTITRRFRQLRIFSEIFDPEVSLNELKDAYGIVLSGGPSSVYDEGSPRCNNEILEMNKPVLGICYGFQYIAHNIGGKVRKKEKGEYGKAVINVRDPVSILKDLGPKEEVWMSHADTVTKLPPGFERLASTKDCTNAAAWHPKKKIVCTQYHPEVDHTENGMKMLDNFLGLCEATEHDWTMKKYLEVAKEEIRKHVRGRKVCHLTSGGGDSTVAAIMLKEDAK